MKEEKQKQDQYDPARSGGVAVLRAAVAVYLIYLGFGLVRAAVTQAADQPRFGWLFGIIFIAVGIAFAVYAWKRYQYETRPPEPDDPEADAESPETPEEDL